VGPGLDTCEIREHGNCSSCGILILRRSPHLHAYFRNPVKHDTLCHACWHSIILASSPILEALAGSGVELSPEAIEEALTSGRVMILVQEPFPV
jgi:hypothetical protein